MLHQGAQRNFIETRVNLPTAKQQGNRAGRAAGHPGEIVFLLARFAGAHPGLLPLDAGRLPERRNQPGRMPEPDAPVRPAARSG